MAEKEIKAKIVFKHKTAEEWETTDYVPAKGEIIIYDRQIVAPDGELPDRTACRIKIGDGYTQAKALKFAWGAGQPGYDDMTGEIVKGAEVFNDYAGLYNRAQGEYSHAEGLVGCVFEGATAAHVEGYNTSAFNRYSHAEGNSSVSYGEASHAEGDTTEASGDFSHAEGLGTVSYGEASHAQGRYNINSNLGYAHVVGNGTTTSSRSNAHTLDWNGNAWFAGDVYVGSTSGTNKDAGSVKLMREASNEGTVDQVLTKTATGYEWADAPSVDAPSAPSINDAGDSSTPIYIKDGEALTCSSFNGNATTASELQIPRDLITDLTRTDSTTFNGSSNATIGVTGTLPIANGGTGATTAEGVLTNLGLTTTAAELNYMDGVTSNVQTQLDSKAPSAHTSDTTAHITAAERTAWNNKQDALTAGTNITITNGTISAAGGQPNEVENDETTISLTPVDNTIYRYPNATDVTITAPSASQYECYIYIGGSDPTIVFPSTMKMVGFNAAQAYSLVTGTEISIKDGRYVITYTGALG